MLNSNFRLKNLVSLIVQSIGFFLIFFRKRQIFKNYLERNMIKLKKLIPMFCSILSLVIIRKK